MREKSVYLSELFAEHVWALYEQTLKRKKTKSNYYTAVCALCDHAKKDFLLIKENDVKKFIEYRRSAECPPTPKTMSTWLSTYRSIGRFIEENQWSEELLNDYKSPFNNMFIEYSDDINVSNLPSENEIHVLLETAAKENEQMYLILLFATKCAMTSGEICSLTPKRIQMDAAGRGFIVFRGKQKNQERIVKIPDCITTYLSEHAATFQSRDYLFINKKGTALSERSLQGHVRKFMEETHMRRPYTIQDIRNLSIAKMLYLGAGEEDTAAYAGIEQRWMYRYSRVIPELDRAPCDLL